MGIREELSRGLNTGFIDSKEVSLEKYHPRLLLNDAKKGCKVLTNLTNELRRCDEFMFSVAFVTNSGVAALISILKELEERGVRGKLVASQYQNFTEPRALRRLIAFNNLEVRIVTEKNFHAKGYIFRENDNYTLIVGSSNLTQNALSYNREWNVKLSSMSEGSLLKETIGEFKDTFDAATVVDELWLEQYEKIYNKEFHYANRELERETREEVASNVENNILFINRVNPNKMQREALQAISNLRAEGKEKALLISATGTGKTYLSAFDVKVFMPKKFLFVVHRENIAKAALNSYKRVIGHDESFGMLTGNFKDFNANYIFATINTLAKEEILEHFKREHFDYIVIDETHRAGAASYQKVLDYFKPKFLLGMTATPERTDGFDIFKSFDYNIAYEIRLNRALEEDMLVPFHYYGVSDITVNGVPLDDTASFNDLTSSTRVDKIIEAAKFYSFDRGRVKGLIFCSSVEESRELSRLFNERGYNTLALSGEDSEDKREEAIRRLEMEENTWDKQGVYDLNGSFESQVGLDKKQIRAKDCINKGQSDNKAPLDYIFTVDIFNEGVDIPAINQIIMLRPTQSSIIFIQQLGRGLRKRQGKEFLVVIDFIGNYKNNFLIPVALYGDNSYNKDNLRRLLKNGSSFIPGASTVNFDRITKEKIFEAINTANMAKKADLVKDYKLLKYRLGKIPSMMDFALQGGRDPYLYVDYANSYFAFVMSEEAELCGKLNKDELKLMEIYSKEIANGKRVEEALLLKMLIDSVDNRVELQAFKEEILKRYVYSLSEATIESIINNLNFGFVTEKENGKLVSQALKYGIKTVEYITKETYVSKMTKIEDNEVNAYEQSNEQFEDSHKFIRLSENSKKALSNGVYRTYLLDALNYAIYTYDRAYSKEKFLDGFILYKKYSRKDVFRILNWGENPVAQNVGGYMVSPDKRQCPIFVNYHKEENISSTTKYEDYFVDTHTFEWVSKSKRSLESPDIMAIKNYKIGMRIPLFVKKNNDEGSEFYYMGGFNTDGRMHKARLHDG